MAHPWKTATGTRTTQDRGWRKPADVGRLKLGRMVQQKARKRIQKVAMVLLVLFSDVQVVEAIRWPMLETAQPLPQQCSDWLKQYGCPERQYFPEKWHNRSQICCAMDHPQTVLQCQEPLVNGKKMIFAACLPDQDIPPGKVGRLIQNDTGFLEADLTTDCAPGTYRTQSINLSFIRYPSCTEKTKEIHAEVMCDGGTINDDLLMCQKEYKSDCSPELQDLSVCPCYLLRCGQGSQPVRSITGHCNDSSIRVTYGCTPMSSIQTSTAASSVSPEKPQESSPVMTPGLTTSQSTDTTTKEEGWSSDVIIGISVGVVIGLVVLIAISVYVWRRCRKRAREYELEKISYSACSSSENAEEIEISE